MLLEKHDCVAGTPNKLPTISAGRLPLVAGTEVKVCSATHITGQDVTGRQQ